MHQIGHNVPKVVDDTGFIRSQQGEIFNKTRNANAESPGATRELTEPTIRCTWSDKVWKENPLLSVVGLLYIHGQARPFEDSFKLVSFLQQALKVRLKKSTNASVVELTVTTISRNSIEM